MMELIEIKLRGWTATPRMPFILSGNAICMATPSYSLLLGLIGCCLGRPVEPEEVRLGFRYEFDGSENDVETRHRLVYKDRKLKQHHKGTDAYTREFHINPNLTLWIDRLDWENFFLNPIGTPALGRSQDLMKIIAVRKINVEQVTSATLKGCMLPFVSGQMIPGHLVQIAEAFRENDFAGLGRTATQSKVFISVPIDNEKSVEFPSLYKTVEGQPFYLHEWS